MNVLIILTNLSFFYSYLLLNFTQQMPQIGTNKK